MELDNDIAISVWRGGPLLTAANLRCRLALHPAINELALRSVLHSAEVYHLTLEKLDHVTDGWMAAQATLRDGYGMPVSALRTPIMFWADRPTWPYPTVIPMFSDHGEPYLLVIKAVAR